MMSPIWMLAAPGEEFETMVMEPVCGVVAAPRYRVVPAQEARHRPVNDGQIRGGVEGECHGQGLRQNGYGVLAAG